MSNPEHLPIPDRSLGTDHEPMPGLEMPDAMREQLDIEERFVPGLDGDPDVRVVMHRPKAATGPLPLLINIHGGAFCLMSPDSFPLMEGGWALGHQCQVVSVDYRLAPEHPFPAGINDCYAVLLWCDANRDELGVTDRTVVTGGSAGGALSAALCQMTRDKGGPAIDYQALMIPVTDDRFDTPSVRDGVNAEGFNSLANEQMWIYYLGEDYDRSNTSPYAAPARATDLRDLPPAFVLVNGLDPLRDQGIEYAMKLLDAGVPVELHCVPGAYHGADPLDPVAAQRGQTAMNEALGQALNA